MFFWVTPSEEPRNKDDLWGIIQDKLFKLPHSVQIDALGQNVRKNCRLKGRLKI